MRLVLCVLLTYAAVSKILDFELLVKYLAMADLVPDRLAPNIAFLVVICEVLASVLMASKRLLRFGVPITAGLIAGFAFTHIVLLSAGTSPECPCFGRLLTLSHWPGLVVCAVMAISLYFVWNSGEKHVQNVT